MKLTQFLAGLAEITFATIMIIALTALTGWAFQTPGSQFQAISADVVPTQQQVVSQLTDLHQRLNLLARASYDSTTADSEYLAAQRSYEFGQYEDALEAVRLAEQSLPTVPNWIDANTMQN